MWTRPRRISDSEILSTAAYVGLLVGVICFVVSLFLLVGISIDTGFLKLILFNDSPSQNWRVAIIFTIAAAIALLVGYATSSLIFRFGQKSSRPK